MPIPRPRAVDTVTSDVFVNLKRRVIELLHEEVLASMSIEESIT